ncbi:MAG: helix-turn-helix domain-containing protein [Proteobacteria bacterium]|nr:helix-turn-helix domain-containing protein [Pseudomonadota bacterium]
MLDDDISRADLVRDILKNVDGFWDVKRAALVLGVAPATIRQYARKKIIPATKLGKSWRFIGRDLLEQLESKWHSTNANRARIKITGYDSESPVKRLDARLAQLTKSAPKNSSNA